MPKNFNYSNRFIGYPRFSDNRGGTQLEWIAEHSYVTVGTDRSPAFPVQQLWKRNGQGNLLPRARSAALDNSASYFLFEVHGIPG